jgi:hypothetical protein
MAEEAAKQAESQESHEGEDHGKQQADDQRIPYERFAEVTKTNNAFKAEVEELRGFMESLKDRDKSSEDREREQRMRLESELNEFRGKYEAERKGSWVRSAATEVNFHDPEDAISHLREQLGELEDPREAQNLVKRLAKSKPHLVREEKKEQPRSVPQMFTGQGVQGQQGQGQRPMTPYEQAQAREMEQAKLIADRLKEFNDKRESFQEFGGLT